MWNLRHPPPGSSREASNYATMLNLLARFKETKALMLKGMPVARRVVGGNDHIMLRMRTLYAQALYCDKGASLDDMREAVATLEDTERIARRVLGGAHPLTMEIEKVMRFASRAPRPRGSS